MTFSFQEYKKKQKSIVSNTNSTTSNKKIVTNNFNSKKALQKQTKNGFRNYSPIRPKFGRGNQGIEIGNVKIGQRKRKCRCTKVARWNRTFKSKKWNADQRKRRIPIDILQGLINPANMFDAQNGTNISNNEVGGSNSKDEPEDEDQKILKNEVDGSNSKDKPENEDEDIDMFATTESFGN